MEKTSALAPQSRGFAAEFTSMLRRLTGLSSELDEDVEARVAELYEVLGEPPRSCGDGHLPHDFYGRMNQKLSLNRDPLARLYSAAASAGVTFNYPTKKALAWAVDSGDAAGLTRTLERVWPDRDVADTSLEALQPVSADATRSAIRSEASRPSKLRKALGRDVAKDVFNAAAGPLAWSLWEPKALHQVFHRQSSDAGYTGDYLHDLRQQSPRLFDRERALTVGYVGAEHAGLGYVDLRRRVTSWLTTEYSKLNNYGFLALIIDASTVDHAWRLVSDAVLYGEHFHAVPLQNMFFRHSDVAAETVRHSPDVDAGAARFELAHEGFTYRDQFVLTDGEGHQHRIVCVMQKNQRDETPVPCPACRSSQIAGNSYPTLGVKSWECLNVLCPDRSIYNRGKRYSFKAILAQEAIEHPSNEIPVDNVRRWQKDVLAFQDDSEIVETLVRHYSITGDGVWLDPSLTAAKAVAVPGRVNHVLEGHAFDPRGDDSFWNGPLFARTTSRPRPPATTSRPPLGEELWRVEEGDAREVLAGIAGDSIDRAITSPPYFNAREYSQWPNLYCYVHDMQAVAREVFRVLKPGSYYAYNIFDTFDNERTITFSDMGKKRISLSSWSIDAFGRLGFELAGNLVWDKGDIHGKRGFNAGNFSPFYQSPFNCWEHVLLFRKPGGRRSEAMHQVGRSVSRIHPVVKMIKGKNTHGHTAPFPLELPLRLMSGLAPGSVVLDPFGGSGTTARAALSVGLRALMVEQDPAYAALSRRLIAEEDRPLWTEQSVL